MLANPGRVFRKLMFVVLGLVLVGVGVCASYQAIYTHFEAMRFPEPGRLVDAGAIRMQLHCTGQGGPVIVLEAGFGDSLSEWSRVQPALAEYTRVCSYDRAGYGSSDAGPFPRTSSRIAEELRALLQAAGERPPYLMVGASFGGYNVRVFHGKYPNEVAGMLLVDATQEDQYALLPAAWKRMGATMLERCRSQAEWSPLYIALGIPRASLSLRGIRPSRLLLQSKYLKARASELEQIQVSAEQARAAGSLGDKPLIVLTAAAPLDATLNSALSPEDLRAYASTWGGTLQMRLARLSSRGKRILVPDSGHDIPSERPVAVIDAARQLCESIRRP